MNTNIRYLIGYELIVIIFISYIITSILFIFDISISKWIFPISYLLVSSIFLLFQLKMSSNNKFKILFYPLIIICLSVFLGKFIWDYSYDGMAYHQVGIYSLIHGWNPIYEKCPFDNIWVNHYAKGMETMSAIIASTFNDIETGKAINFIFIISSFLILYDVINDFFPKKKKVSKILLTVLITFSPVVICQFLTFYIDFMSYVLIVLIAANIYIYEKKHSWKPIIMIAICMALAISIKFNIAFWCGLELILYCIYLIWKKEWNKIKRGVTCTIIGSFIGLFLLSYNPYITNIKDGHHMLYPLLGEGKVDIMTKSTPYEIKDMNNFSGIIYSLFSRPNNFLEEVNFSKKNKIKLSLLETGNTDTRLGGFGFIFPEILILSILSIILLSIKKNSKTKKLFLILLSLFISLFILPSGWWARYVPFFYLFPIIILLYIEKFEQNKTWMSKLFIFLLFINISITSLFVARKAYYGNKNIANNINLLNTNNPIYIKSENYGFNFKLEKAGISTIQSDSATYKLNIIGPNVYIQK